jgi:hypothetical protein
MTAVTRFGGGEDRRPRPLRPMPEAAMTTDPTELPPGAPLAGTGLRRTCLYQLDGDTINGLTADQREPLLQWTRDHGLDPKRITTASPVRIYREPNGADYVTVRVTDDPPQSCTGCGCCLRSDPVWVPWNGVYPPVSGGWRGWRARFR